MANATKQTKWSPFADFRKRSNKFDDEAKAKFLQVYSETGRFTYAAECALVCTNTARDHIKKDPAFAQAFEEAGKFYGDFIQAEIHRRAIEGVPEPVINFRDNSIACHVLKYSDRLLELNAKRYVPEYRDRLALEASVSAGVLVVTAAATVSPEEWADKFNKKKEKK